jgi:alkylation response protein AidB-like acyl-CoA dehydrogenase
MASPGISVRPIVNLEMHDEFSEVFFDNVRVPKENLVGQLNKGWDMAKALLSFERIYLGSPRRAPMRSAGCACWPSAWAWRRSRSSPSATPAIAATWRI